MILRWPYSIFTTRVSTLTLCSETPRGIHWRGLRERVLPFVFAASLASRRKDSARS